MAPLVCSVVFLDFYFLSFNSFILLMAKTGALWCYLKLLLRWLYTIINSSSDFGDFTFNFL